MKKESYQMKEFYKEIIRLHNNNGCWKTDNQFAKTYKVRRRTIQRWINFYKDKDMIRSEKDYNPVGEYYGRVLIPGNDKMSHMDKKKCLTSL